MTISLRSLGVAALVVSSASAALAQTPTSTTAQPSSTESSTRPATTTFQGDTGLWFVPTAEILGDRQWSASFYRRGTNYVQGFTNVGDFAGTFAFGLRDRAEIFGSLIFDTRIDRDLRPLFSTDPDVGGAVDRYPFNNRGWTGNNLGDFSFGVKVNLMSEFRQQPAGVAIRGVVKTPTGDKDAGVSTGKPDFAFDLIVSKETTARLDVSAFGGYEFRGQPDDVDSASGAFRWGAGVGFPSRSPLRGIFELTGNVPSSDTMTFTGPRIQTIDTISPVTSPINSLTTANAGVTWQHRNGFFVGGGIGWNFPMKDREAFGVDSDPSSLPDFADWQVRLGFHPGVRVYVPPPPPPPPATPPPPPAANRPPTVQARCEPCTVEVGRTATVTADAKDPDGDTVTYKWSAPSGTLQNPGDRQTAWVAPQQDGPVQITVTVSDGKGGTASASTTIQVVRPTLVELTFEDVYFDFDRSTLRPEALRLLDDAIAKLKANPGRNIVIEGHTCNIGTAEYNLALGDRRASAVREYLVSRGVAAGLLETRSFGEERPKFDNAREETRRLNRRAALVVRVQ
jgi:outer membrane protein OmpA-like peptidoglycan-associated protein